MASAMPVSNLSKTYKFDIDEIYDRSFVKTFAIFVHITTIFSITLTFILIYVIINKTPKSMGNLKIYLLPYSIHTVVIDLVYGTYVPIFLHPFVYFYPGGFIEAFPRDFLYITVVCGTYSAIGLYDCIIGLAFERSFALRNIENLIQIPSTIPFYYFCILSFSSICCLFLGITCNFIKPLIDAFIVPVEEIPKVVQPNIHGIEGVLILNSLAIIQGSAQNTLPIFVVLGGLFASGKVVLAFVVTFLNGLKTERIKYLMPVETQKSNAMLLRMNYFQLAGFAIFIVCPVAIVTFTFWFVSTPAPYVNYCLGVMNFFGLYDTLMTLICIKPYRIFVFGLFKRKLKHNKVVFTQSMTLSNKFN